MNLNVSYRTFNYTMILLAITCAALLPLWPYSTWGYLPSSLAGAALAFMFMLKMLNAE